MTLDPGITKPQILSLCTPLRGDYGRKKNKQKKKKKELFFGKTEPFGILGDPADWTVPLKMVAKMSGHWPNGLPPRVSATYIEDTAKNFIFRTESHTKHTGSLPGSSQVSNTILRSIYCFLILDRFIVEIPSLADCGFCIFSSGQETFYSPVYIYSFELLHLFVRFPETWAKKTVRGES